MQVNTIINFKGIVQQNMKMESPVENAIKDIIVTRSFRLERFRLR